MVGQLLEIMSADPQMIKDKLDIMLKESPKASIFGGGAGQIIHHTTRLKRVIEVANQEATILNDEYISTEHLFLAIVEEKRYSLVTLIKRKWRNQRSCAGCHQRTAWWTESNRPQSGDALSHIGKIFA